MTASEHHLARIRQDIENASVKNIDWVQYFFHAQLDGEEVDEGNREVMDEIYTQLKSEGYVVSDWTAFSFGKWDISEAKGFKNYVIFLLRPHIDKKEYEKYGVAFS